MKINNLDRIIKHAIAFIEDDITELWVIVSKIVEENPELSFQETIEATRTVLQFLVAEKKVKVLNDETMEPLYLTVTEIMQLVEEKFNNLKTIPNIGDGFWLSI